MSENKGKELYLDFDEYIRQGEPAQQEKAGYWQTAIGLQAVDGLTVSDYLQNTARRHIEGAILQKSGVCSQICAPPQAPHKYPTSTLQVQD